MSDTEKPRPTPENQGETEDSTLDVMIGPDQNHSLHAAIMNYADEQARRQRPDWFDETTGGFSEAGREKVRGLYGFWVGFDKVLDRVEKELREKR